MRGYSLGLLNCSEFIGGLQSFWLVLEYLVKVVY